MDAPADILLEGKEKPPDTRLDCLKVICVLKPYLEMVRIRETDKNRECSPIAVVFEGLVVAPSGVRETCAALRMDSIHFK